MSITAFNGTKVLLTDERWKHIVLRHPELENKLSLVLDTVANPDEVYLDHAGMFHALKRLSGEVSDYLVVIYGKENREGYIRTTFYTSSRRKNRRYKQFKKLKPS
ncbi:MAG: PBECR2 nuclease fold domain-containing protein [Candidatus Bathyarchaeales archaeon]